MLRTVEGVINEQGEVKPLEDVKLSSGYRVLLTECSSVRRLNMT